LNIFSTSRFFSTSLSVPIRSGIESTLETEHEISSSVVISLHFIQKQDKTGQDCLTMTPALRDIRNRGIDDISDTSQEPVSPEKLTRHTGELLTLTLKETPMSLADMAHAELSDMLARTILHNHSNPNANSASIYREAFPVACKRLLHSLPGNRNCVDCNVRDPEWAAVSYGALVCIQCSGRHRSLGVAVSQVRSVSMDHWTHKEVVSMLEGGNAQVGGFFARNALTKPEFEKQELQQQQKQRPSRISITADNVMSLRYKTKAALFYKNQLEAHVGRLLEDPSRRPYKGRSHSHQQ